MWLNNRSFEVLHERYGVPDRETYALFRMLYEKYGVRQTVVPQELSSIWTRMLTL